MGSFRVPSSKFQVRAPTTWSFQLGTWAFASLLVELGQVVLRQSVVRRAVDAGADLGPNQAEMAADEADGGGPVAGGDGVSDAPVLGDDGAALPPVGLE